MFVFLEISIFTCTIKEMEFKSKCVSFLKYCGTNDLLEISCTITYFRVITYFFIFKHPINLHKRSQSTYVGFVSKITKYIYSDF